MWYVIEGHDGDNVLARRMEQRPAHLARLRALLDEGRLLIAGPCPAIDAEDPGAAAVGPVEAEQAADRPGS